MVQPDIFQHREIVIGRATIDIARAHNQLPLTRQLVNTDNVDGDHRSYVDSHRQISDATTTGRRRVIYGILVMIIIRTDK